MIFLAFSTTSARSTMSTKTPATIVVANTRWLGLVCRMTWVSCAKRPASLRRIRASIIWDGGTFGSSGTDIIRHDAVARILGAAASPPHAGPVRPSALKAGAGPDRVGAAPALADRAGDAPLPRLQAPSRWKYPYTGSVA